MRIQLTVMEFVIKLNSNSLLPRNFSLKILWLVCKKFYSLPFMTLFHSHARHLHSFFCFAMSFIKYWNIKHVYMWVGRMFIIVPEATFPQRQSWKVKMFLHFLHHSLSGRRAIFHISTDFLWFLATLKKSFKRFLFSSLLVKIHESLWSELRS
jgi:hypothetical protein